MAPDIPTAVAQALEARDRREAVSIAVEANAVDLLEHLLATGVVPDVLTDQTSAHDALLGYVPQGLSFADAQRLRVDNPHGYIERSMAAMASHVRAMLALQERGAVTFDYGNNLRGQALAAGETRAFDIGGFVPMFIRPLFCEGKGPFRWAVLSGDPEDIAATDEAMLATFPEDAALARWIRLARERVAFQGLPARICWLGYGERAKAGQVFNELVASGKVKAPIVIGRDHLDCGSVASPNRETEGMMDGSDAIGDWPILNAMLNAVNGATWVSVHHGGGVGIGYSLHAGMVIVADGTAEAARRLERVLTGDPGMGVVRHADAGYPQAIACARERGVDVPMLAPPTPPTQTTRRRSRSDGSVAAAGGPRLAAARPRAGRAHPGRDPAGRRPGGGAAPPGRPGGRRVPPPLPALALAAPGARAATRRPHPGPRPGVADGGVARRPPRAAHPRRVGPRHAAGVLPAVGRPAPRGRGRPPPPWGARRRPKRRA